MGFGLYGKSKAIPIGRSRGCLLQVGLNGGVRCPRCPDVYFRLTGQIRC